MTKIKLEIPSVGEKNVVAEPKVDTALKKVEEFLNEKNIESTDNLKKEGIAEESLSKALQEKLVTNVGLTYVKKAASFEGVSSNFYEMETAAATLTLPAPTANRMIGAIPGSTSCKIKASAGKIVGDFLEAGQTTVELLQYQHLLVLANGTNWVIIAGEPKREQKYVAKIYTAAEANAGVEPSATRLAFVLLGCETQGLPIVVGGVETAVSSASNVAYTSILVPAGQKWAVNVKTTAITLLL